MKKALTALAAVAALATSTTTALAAVEQSCKLEIEYVCKVK